MTDPTPQTTPTRDEAANLSRMVEHHRKLLADTDNYRVLDRSVHAHLIDIIAALASAPAPASGGVGAVTWESMDTAPKGYPTEDAGCRGTSEWFVGRVAKEFRKHGAAPVVVIRRKAWPHDTDWECNGEAHYVPRYFDGWKPLEALSSPATQEPQS